MEYICVYINAINLSPYVTGTAQPKMNSILVHIPPIEEQHRIVAKIEESCLTSTRSEVKP